MPEHGGALIERRLWHSREVLVEAASVEVAQRASDLVRLATAVVANMAIFEAIEVRPWVKGADPTNYVGMGGFPLAMWIAAKASRQRARVRALAKSGLSFQLWSTAPIELDPGHAPFHLPRSSHPEHHVRLAYAIVLAYAAIEELGLEVRASSAKPSILPDGSWNREVRADLEGRLLAAGIDLSEPAAVLQRGRPTRIDRKRAGRAARARWRPRGHVGDADIAVVDAINDVSFLRSKVSSHANKDIETLSPYDAATAQLLARRLLLESLGAWRMLFPKPAPAGGVVEKK